MELQQFKTNTKFRQHKNLICKCEREKDTSLPISKSALWTNGVSMLTPLICQIVWRSSMSYSNMIVTTLCMLATSTIYFIRVLCTPQYKFTLALSLVRFQFAPKVVQRFVLCGLNGCLFEATYDVLSNVYLPNLVSDTCKHFRVVDKSNCIAR